MFLRSLGVSSFSYGWVIVGALAITETVSWGCVYYAFTVILPLMEAELHWSRIALTGAFSLASLTSGIAAPLFGRWLDRHGGRLLMTLGSVGATLLLFAWSNVTDLVTLYLIWAGLGVTMAAIFYEPAFVIINAWFAAQRSQALAIVTFAAAFASTIFIPLTTELSQRMGWRPAVCLLSVIVGVLTIPLHALVLKKHPRDRVPKQDQNQQPLLSAQNRTRSQTTLHDALRQEGFWWLTSGFTLTTLSAIALTIHLIPYLLDLGYDAHFAALAAGTIGATKFPGRLAFAPLERRLPHRQLAALLILLQGIAVVSLLFAPGPFGVLCSVALFGAASGAGTLSRPALIADYYGSTHYGSINGVVASFLAGAQALAPVGAGVLYVWFGSYQPVLGGFALIFAMALGAVLKIKPPIIRIDMPTLPEQS